MAGHLTASGATCGTHENTFWPLAVPQVAPFINSAVVMQAKGRAVDLPKSALILKQAGKRTSLLPHGPRHTLLFQSSLGLCLLLAT